MSDESTTPQPAGSATPGHEPDAVNARWIALGFCALAALLGGAALLVYGVWALGYRETEPARQPYAAVADEDPRPQPALDPDQPQSLQELHAEQREILESYGWIRQDENVARIPIERAIELLAKKGRPTK